MNDVIEKAKKLCRDGRHKLLYLVKFGSHLYGTDTPESDLDIMGVMAPSIQSLVLQDSPKTIQQSSGPEDGKNTKGDYDIVLYAVQYWLTKKVRTMEINAMDLLFSPSYPDAVIYINPLIQPLFDNLDKLFDMKDTDDMAYVRYAHRQTKKYGLKGTTVGIMKRIMAFFDENFKDIHQATLIRTKLDDYADRIIQVAGNIDRCHLEKSELKDGVEYVVVAGRKHQTTISMFEFYNRIKRDYDRYGKRAREAEQNKNIDWKACSHALRAIYQMEQFFKEGKVTFPLAQKDFVKEVKAGNHTWKEIEAKIINGIEGLELMGRAEVLSTYAWNQQFVKDFILSLYLEGY